MQIKINAVAHAQLIKYMLEGTYNCRELAELTGMHYVTVVQYTRQLHRAGACHVFMWDKDTRGRDAIKIYKLGVGQDAKRQSISARERNRRYRAKRKALELHQMLIGRGHVDVA